MRVIHSREKTQVNQSDRNLCDEITNGSDDQIIITTHLISIYLISTRLQYWMSILPDCWIVSDTGKRNPMRFYRIE